MTTPRQFTRRLPAIASAVALLAILGGEARASFYAYAVEQTDTYTFSGATMGAFSPGSSTSAAQVGSPSGSEGHAATLDALQSYVGPIAGRPAENTFTPLGQVNPDYARGDALVTVPPSAIATNNVAESYMVSAGNSAASGSWAVSAPITVTAAGAVTLGFHYTNQLTVTHTGVPGGTVAADYSYVYTIRDATGAAVFTTSPDAINANTSLTAVGSISTPGSGTIAITSGTLAVGSYTVSITGSEHTFINSVPEPSSCVLLGLGGLGLVGLARRRGRAA
jgi:PEP-CTERM motif